MQLNQYIDHTLLKATATPADIHTLCAEAMQHQFHAVCVNSGYVSLASQAVAQSQVKVAAVVGFPLGAMSRDAKVYEAQDCIQQGASEIDMVLNLGLLKAGFYEAVEAEIRAVKQAIGGHLLKVILETCYLTDNEKQIACELAIAAAADFVKTSTGFGTAGATLADIELMRQTVGNRVQIKASGGIKDPETAIQFIQRGVSRLGTSASIQLVTASQGIIIPSRGITDEY